MTDMRKSIMPKSDQLNSDDLIGITKIIVVTKVSGLDDVQQPIAIHFEGDNGKPYKPCKSMRRVLVHCWGDDGKAYVGKSMKLYQDPNVVFGGVKVGGIRISHLSHIEHEMTMALTASKTVRKPYTVKPLVAAGTAAFDIDLKKEGDEAAQRGTDILKAFWQRLKTAQQEPLLSYVDGWKAIAKQVDVAPQEEIPEESAKLSNIFSAG